MAHVVTHKLELEKAMQCIVFLNSNVMSVLGLIYCLFKVQYIIYCRSNILSIVGLTIGVYCNILSIVGLHCHHQGDQPSTGVKRVMKVGRRDVFNGDLSELDSISVILEAHP